MLENNYFVVNLHFFLFEGAVDIVTISLVISVKFKKTKRRYI